MTNKEIVERWHRERPDFVKNWSALHWDLSEVIAEKLDAEHAPEVQSCDLAPAEHYCVKAKGHKGSCEVYRLDGDD